MGPTNPIFLPRNFPVRFHRVRNPGELCPAAAVDGRVEAGKVPSLLESHSEQPVPIL